MSTATFDAIDMALLILIGVVTLVICFGGIGWAYRMEQRGGVKKAPRARHHSNDHGAEQRRAASKSARNSDIPVNEGQAADAQRAQHGVGH